MFRDEFSGKMTPGRELREGVYLGEILSRRGWEYSQRLKVWTQ